MAGYYNKALPKKIGRVAGAFGTDHAGADEGVDRTSCRQRAVGRLYIFFVTGWTVGKTGQAM